MTDAQYNGLVELAHNYYLSAYKGYFLAMNIAIWLVVCVASYFILKSIKKWVTRNFLNWY